MANQGTFYGITGGTFLSVFLNNFTMQPNTITYTGTANIIVKISVNVSWFKDGNGDENFVLAISRNNSIQTSSKLTCNLKKPGGGYPTTTHISCIQNITNGDVLSPVMSCITGADESIVADITMDVIQIQ